MKYAVWLWAAALTVLITGCGGDQITSYAPKTDGDASGLFWSLPVNVTMATVGTIMPYDTVRLIATPMDQRGNPLEGLGPVQFRVADAEVAEVSPDGLVRGLKIGSTDIYVQLTAMNVTHKATVRLSVVDAPSKIPTAFKLLADGAREIRWPLFGTGEGLYLDARGAPANNTSFSFTFGTVTDANGDPVPGLQGAVTIGDTTIVRSAFSYGSLIDNLWAVLTLSLGKTTAIGRISAFGVTLVDTVDVIITMPQYAVVRVLSRPIRLGQPNTLVFASSDVTVSVGGTVIWSNVTGEPIEIVFEDPANVVEYQTLNCGADDVGGRGNIAAFGEYQDPEAGMISPANCRTRVFPVAGVYRYRDPRSGATGQVVVSE